MMNNKFAVLLGMLFILTGCGGSDDPVTTPAGADAISGSGTIQSAINGYILKSASSSSYGSFNSSSEFFYTYDSNNRTVTRSKSPDATDEDSIRSIITLTSAGMPDVRTLYGSSGDITLVETNQHDSANRLLSISSRVEFNGVEGLIEYDYNNAGQMVVERSVDPATRAITSLATYDYDEEGLVLTAEYSLTPLGGVFETILFQHDSVGRVSGYNAVSSLFGSSTTNTTLVWDENNNIIQIDTFDESGQLTRSRSYEYVETEDAVYNSILYDYIYGPAIQ